MSDHPVNGSNGAKPLEKMSGVELRAYARAHGLRITYLSERRRDVLLTLVQEALQTEGGENGHGQK